jgi:TRAP-type C4-dicarboxylate transport system permease small subunit
MAFNTLVYIGVVIIVIIIIVVLLRYLFNVPFIMPVTPAHD